MAGLESLRRTPVYNIANALVGVSETRRTVNHGHLIFVGHEGSMTRYMIPMDGSRADMSAYSRDVAKKLIDCEGYEGAMFFDEDGRLKGMEMAVDVSLIPSKKEGKNIFSYYELSNYGIKGGEIGPKFGYACALTSCDSGITAIVHSRDKRVAVIKHGRPIWVYKSGHLKEYEWRPADSIDDSSLPVSEAVATDSRSTALAVQLLETIRGMDAFDSYERAVHTFPHGLLVVIATPEVGREYCVPINGANIFKDKYIEVGDDDVERYIERAAQIEGAVFVNNARQELVTTNLALDNKLPRPLEGGLRHYMGLPEGSGMKTIRAAAMARYTPAAALVVRTPKREKPFEAYAMYDDQILKSEPKKQRSRIWPISGVLSYSRR